MLEWNDYTKAVVIEKNKKSDDFFVYILLQRSFRSWQKVRHYDSIILLLINFLIAYFMKIYIYIYIYIYIELVEVSNG